MGGEVCRRVGRRSPVEEPSDSGACAVWWSWPRLRPCRPSYAADVAPTHERVSKGTFLVIEIFAVTAATWAVLMGIAPLSRVRRMLQRRSSADVSVGYLLVLLPGFALWVAYGVASDDLALVIPNVVAFVVAAGTVICVLRLRTVAAENR